MIDKERLKKLLLTTLLVCVIVFLIGIVAETILNLSVDSYVNQYFQADENDTGMQILQ